MFQSHRAFLFASIRSILLVRSDPLRTTFDRHNYNSNRRGETMHPLDTFTAFRRGLACGFLLLCMPMLASAQPRTAPPSEVRSCLYLNRVEGSSGYGKNTDWHNLAWDAVLRSAEKLGASPVVRERLNPTGAFSGSVMGRAYRCKS